MSIEIQTSMGYYPGYIFILAPDIVMAMNAMRKKTIAMPRSKFTQRRVNARRSMSLQMASPIELDTKKNTIISKAGIPNAKAMSVRDLFPPVQMFSNGATVAI